jgi:hypothetical protein
LARLYTLINAIISCTSTVECFFRTAATVRQIDSAHRSWGAMLIVVATFFIAQPALAQFTQQGAKLVGTGAVGNPYQATSSAVSRNGNTLIVGGYNDGGGLGAAWVFTRSGANWSQQGNKLVGTGAVGSANQGKSVVISADGNTAIVGGSGDNGGAGAAWIFTRNGSTWSQQGSKLIGTGAVGSANQGYSVAISADGNTALVGGLGDNGSIGAAWVFTRSGGTWSQQGSKLVGTGWAGFPSQGWSVALSSDGNTALVGGYFDNGATGAVWVFTRSGGSWTQQGSKLVGTGAVGFGYQGYSVALSGDGSTAILGGFGDNGNRGASWIFTRSGGTWSQQGSKLTGNDVVGNANQGLSVSLSTDGSTALVGGPADNGNAGAVWIFNRSGNSWLQQGNKLIGAGATGAAYQGRSVALSADAKTIVLGGYQDNGGVGATWVFAQPGAGLGAAAHDFNGDGKSDILWRDGGGSVAQWLMNGWAVTATSVIGNIPPSWSVVGQRDFDGDGKHDILWRDGGGNVALWLMNGATVSSAVNIGFIPANWSVVGTADFDGDRKGDILWRDGGGNVAAWFMNGTTLASVAVLGNIPANWNVVGTGDFDGNGKGDILWRDGGGNVAAWFMNGATVTSVVTLGNIPANWNVVGTGDFDGDGKTDILWRDGGGNVAVWFMNGATIASIVTLGNIPANWFVTQTGDYNGDGKSDILWRDGGGNVAIWFMNGATLALAIDVGNIPANWVVQGASAD